MTADTPRDRPTPPPLDDWQRIEAEWDERHQAQRKWDQEHDPSDEFEQAARPLGPNYGEHRPTTRTPEELQEIREVFGLTEDQVARLRAKMFNEMEHRRTRWESSES